MLTSMDMITSNLLWSFFFFFKPLFGLVSLTFGSLEGSLVIQNQRPR